VVIAVGFNFQFTLFFQGNHQISGKGSVFSLEFTKTIHLDFGGACLVAVYSFGENIQLILESLRGCSYRFQLLVLEIASGKIFHWNRKMRGLFLAGIKKSGRDWNLRHRNDVGMT
jgi:hypothetical protein